MGLGHLYVTAHGKYTAAWVGEFGQIGARWTWWGNTESGPFIQNTSKGEVEVISQEDSNTKFNITRTFQFDTGVILGPQSDSRNVMDDLVADFDKFTDSLITHQSSAWSWTHFKVSPVDHQTGKALAPATIYAKKVPGAGQGTSLLPPEVSVAMSLRAPVLGRRGRGRMYLPACSGVAGTDGKVQDSVRTSLATKLQTFCQDWANLEGLDQFNCGVIITSSVNPKTGNAPNTFIVPTEVRIGDHADVQRRRQHQVQENYTTLPL